jgi:tRNA A37 threonylcarbamoyladenosine synthetase subunit TsaC/SUA5/YrdC
MFSARPLSSASLVHCKVLVCILLFLQGATALRARELQAGLAWHVQGTWRVQGVAESIRSGDAIEPASLLQPDEVAGPHSVTILLPDGQRVLYECFTAADCARGFRVPSLIRKPNPFALDMLTRIGSILLRDSAPVSNERHANPSPQPARQQAVAVLDAANRVHVAGLISDLPNGRYTCDLRPQNHAWPPQHGVAIAKSGSSIKFNLPAPGLYDIVITDTLNTPRIDLFLAAIRPSESADFQSFHQAREMMETWNEDYAGWPIDDFLRAYLESLVENARH